MSHEAAVAEKVGLTLKSEHEIRKNYEMGEVCKGNQYESHTEQISEAPARPLAIK